MEEESSMWQSLAYKMKNVGTIDDENDAKNVFEKWLDSKPWVRGVDPEGVSTSFEDFVFRTRYEKPVKTHKDVWEAFDYFAKESD